MAGRNEQGERVIPGSRKADHTIDDALRTMERLAAWLQTAQEENIWRQTTDPFQAAMLHGMLTHLQKEIEGLIELGGDELLETVFALRTFPLEEQEI